MSIKIEDDQIPVLPIFKARRFELYDEEGRLRGEWKNRDGGGSGINFFDANGQPRLEAGTGLDGRAYLGLYAPNGVGKVYASVTNEGHSHIIIFGAGFEPNAVQVVVDNDQVMISLGGKEEKVFLAAMKDVPTFFVRDEPRDPALMATPTAKTEDLPI